MIQTMPRSFHPPWKPSLHEPEKITDSTPAAIEVDWKPSPREASKITASKGRE
jgi:hypothetical protein